MSTEETRDGVRLTNLDQPLFGGAAIAVPRVQALHEGKRRARARRG